MNRKELERIKEKIINRICIEYNPRPQIIEVWYSYDSALFLSIVKFNKKDTELFLAHWDKETNCIDEIAINNYTYNRIKQFL